MGYGVREVPELSRAGPSIDEPLGGHWDTRRIAKEMLFFAFYSICAFASIAASYRGGPPAEDSHTVRRPAWCQATI